MIKLLNIVPKSMLLVAISMLLGPFQRQAVPQSQAGTMDEAHSAVILSARIDKLMRIYADSTPFPKPQISLILRMTAPELVDRVDSLYLAALDYQFLSLRSLRLAKASILSGNTDKAEEYIKNADKYYQVATALRRDSQAVLDGTYSAVETATEGVKKACQTASVLGLRIMNPVLGKAVDYLYIGIDYAVDSIILGEEEAKRNILKRLIVKALFEEVKFSELGNRTIFEYMKNRIGKQLFPLIDTLLQSEEAKFAVARIIKELGVMISEEVLIQAMLSSGEVGVSQAPGDLLRTFSDPSDSNSGQFGSTVISVDSYIFVGASPMSGGGVVYMYNPKDGALTRTFSTPTPECVNGGFGRVLADYQGNLLVGAWQEPSGLNLYDIQSGQRLDAYPNKGGLGISAAVDGTQILAGVLREGVAYLFDGRDKTILQKYVPPVPTINFGVAVAFAGDHVVVGATGHRNDYERSGAAFVFDRTTGNHLHTLLDPHPTGHGSFGCCIAASGNDILIGKFNSSKFVYLYDGSTFTLKDTFEDPKGSNNGFGRSIAVMGDYVLIGSPAEDISSYNSGAAFLFDIKTCDLLHTYLDPTPMRNGGFGTSVAFCEGNVLIGEWGQSSAVPGEVHLFKMIKTIPD